LHAVAALAESRLPHDLLVHLPPPDHQLPAQKHSRQEVHAEVIRCVFCVEPTRADRGQDYSPGREGATESLEAVVRDDERRHALHVPREGAPFHKPSEQPPPQGAPLQMLRRKHTSITISKT
jgi:hypothetical protein